MRIVTLALLIWLLPGAAAAQQDGADLTFRVLVGAKADAGIEDVCCGPDMAGFAGEPVDHIRTWYGDAPFWLKLEGIPGSGLVQFRPVLDKVTLYARPAGSDQWQTVMTGDTVANSRKVFATPFMALPLPDDVDASAVYARIDQPTAVAIRARHWSLPPFIALHDADRTLKIFLLGFVSAVIVYNLVVSVLVRDPAFALNALCIGSLLALALYLSGYGVSYVWVGRHELSNSVNCLSILGGVVFGSAFIYMFLRNDEETAAHYWPVFAAPAIALTGATVLLLAQVPYWRYQLLFLGCAILLLAGTSWVATRKAVDGDRKARILLFPLLMAVVPGILLVMLDKIGGVRPINLGNNAMEVTLAMEAILFSLALASRIRVTEAAHRGAVMELLHSQQQSASIALTAQDAERKRLAKELHDSVGQEVLVIVSHLKRLMNDPAAAGVVGRLREIAGAISATMDNLRRVSHAMHPASIEHLGLEGAVQELIDQFNATEQVDFTGHLMLDDAEISHDRQLHLVRIIQECLSNVIRHSKATRCEIEMTREGDRLEIRISDNGIGAGENLLTRSERFGLGLTSVDERVRSLGGTWRIREAESGGLTADVSVPLSDGTTGGAPQ